MNRQGAEDEHEIVCMCVCIYVSIHPIDKTN